eukprot:261621-Rhodomonas_salina.1
MIFSVSPDLSRASIALSFIPAWYHTRSRKYQREDLATRGTGISLRCEINCKPLHHVPWTPVFAFDCGEGNEYLRVLLGSEMVVLLRHAQVCDPLCQDRTQHRTLVGSLAV